MIGSYPQPDWLIDRERLRERLPPRVRARELWRVAGAVPRAGAGRRDARSAIRDMERAGIDIVTDGEMRRESYSNRFATALEGIDLDNPATALDRTGKTNAVPRVVGPDPAHAGRSRCATCEFLRAQHRPARSRSPFPGPFTMTQQAQNELLRRRAGAGAGLRRGGQRGAARPAAAGADVVQIDEP